MARLKMKVMFGVLIIICSLIFAYIHRFPYYYLPLPKYWAVENIGFQEILEPDDFTRYYIDKMDSKGYDKKEVRYSALYQAYRASEQDGYVNIASLISLVGYLDEVDDAIILRKYLLENHLDFKNRCYNYMCGSGHHMSGIATEYARDMRENGRYREAFDTLKNMILSRKNDLKPWVRFGDLEEVYFLLNEMPYGQEEISFFDSELLELKEMQSSKKLEGRYASLLAGKEKIRDGYNK